MEMEMEMDLLDPRHCPKGSCRWLQLLASEMVNGMSPVASCKLLVASGWLLVASCWQAKNETSENKLERQSGKWVRAEIPEEDSGRHAGGSVFGATNSRRLFLASYRRVEC